MNARSIFGKLLLAVIATASAGSAQTTPAPARAGSADTVHVAPPVGEREADRASILAAVERVRPGGTVQFAPGTYLIGRFIDVAVPRITLAGHPDGTTIRGCDPAGFADMDAAIAECNGFNLTGGGQTVSVLEFEHTWHALVLGGLTCDVGACRPDTPPIEARAGGYIVEASTFRESQNGIRVVGEWSEPAVIRYNRFVNTYHAVIINGMTAHIVDNLISVPDPERVPYTRHPGGAFGIMGWDAPGRAAVCDNNVIARNRITGHPDAILIAVAAGGRCRGNEIRDNTIESSPVRFTSPSTALFVRSAADSTLVGVPIALLNGVFGDGTIEDNLIEGNRIVGASGLAVQVTGASRNRIVNNTITGVAWREPYPGNTLYPRPPEWGDANGSGIWVSPGSDGNEIVGNTFADVAADAVVVKGDRNRVETRTPADAVRDLGSGNQVSRTDAAEIAALTARYVEFLNDEWSGGASTLFASDATMSLADGLVLEGRDAIIRDFFRPAVARLRGLVPSSTKVIEGERQATVVSTFTARFAPAPDTVRGSFSNSWARQPDGSWLIAAATFELPGWQDDSTSAPGIRSGFFEADGLRIHYLDSGGAGVPLLFMPIRDRTAYSFIEFAERFTDRHRVLAITSRGTGQSEGELDDLFSVANAARDAIALLDALRIERAVVVPAWSADIGIILANLHPDRLAGLIFTGGLPTPDLFELWDADSTGMLAMAARLYFSVDGIDPDEGMRRMRAQHEEGARHRRIDAPIRVPALAFVAESGAADVENRWEAELGLARWVADEPGMFGDSVSREFYLKLASDEQLQDSVRALYRDLVAPRYRAVEQVFSTAFGSGLRLVPVEAQRIGYGYRDAPDMIYPHIRRFLDDVIEHERRRVPTDADTIHVAAPTGERDADRTSIIAALAQVQPGGTVQFAAGTYLIGEMISVTTPRVTLLGHPEGTTLRGCNPEDVAGMQASMESCNGLELAGARQTVRGFTFEHAFWALHLGCCYNERATYDFPDGSIQELPVVRRGAGGHRVEGNTFRSASSGIRVNGGWAEPSIVRGNRFIDNWHAISINGHVVHVLDNHFSVPQPECVPDYGFAWDAIRIAPPMPIQGETGPPECVGNVIVGNTIEGYLDGIRLEVYLPGSICRENVIRDNTIAVRRAHNPSGSPFSDGGESSDSSVVGVPIALLNDPIVSEYAGSDAPTFVEENIVEGNRILGAEGLGIEVLRASRNRIANNVIERVVAREPFPGNTRPGASDAWRQANGSGIWISPGSDRNEIVGNTFTSVAAHAVVLEGEGNRVESRSARDLVQDLGVGNRVSGLSAPDTTRYTAMPGGIPRGERLVWLEEPNTRRYAMLFGPPGAPNRPRLESTIELNADGIPIRIEVRGFQPHGAPWEERFELRGDTAVWSTPAEQGAKVIAGPTYYPSLLAGAMYHPWPAFGAYDLGLLARALLRQPDRSLTLLPDGAARLEEVERRVVEVDRRTRTVALYAIHGLDLAPAYVWLDEGGEFFADQVSVAVGWESVYRELAQASRAALVEHARERLASSIVPSRVRPLVIRGARLFDPATRSVRNGTTIVVEGRRIAAVGPDGSIAAPPGSQVIEAAGRTVLPGLWDMHVHFQPGWSDELSAPLFIAAGVTTTRDLGGETDLVVSLRQRTETGETVGPRILPALIMYGPGQHALGAGVGTAEQAREAVDRFAALGYVQVKLYNPVPPELVSVIVERARHHGMRVSGHIPNGMTGEEAIEGGFDELQHLLYARVAAAGIRNLATDSAVGSRLAAVRTDSEEWEMFVRLLRARGTGIDATLAVVEESVGRNPAAWLTPVLDRFPAQAARVAARTAGPPAPPPMLREHWDEIVANGPELVRALHEAGVPLVLGTDAPIGGFELHREMELFVQAGIPAPDVLQLVTLGAARVMGMDHELGSIEPGKLADLILVDGDPTTDIGDIRRVATVVKDGRVYDPAAIYQALGFRR